MNFLLISILNEVNAQQNHDQQNQDEMVDQLQQYHDHMKESKALAYFIAMGPNLDETDEQLTSIIRQTKIGYFYADNFSLTAYRYPEVIQYSSKSGQKVFDFVNENRFPIVFYQKNLNEAIAAKRTTVVFVYDKNDTEQLKLLEEYKQNIYQNYKKFNKNFIFCYTDYNQNIHIFQSVSKKSNFIFMMKQFNNTVTNKTANKCALRQSFNITDLTDLTSQANLTWAETNITQVPSQKGRDHEKVERYIRNLQRKQWLIVHKTNIIITSILIIGPIIAIFTLKIVRKYKNKKSNNQKSQIKKQTTENKNKKDKKDDENTAKEQEKNVKEKDKGKGKKK